jgi:hypothetical protein
MGRRNPLLQFPVAKNHRLGHVGATHEIDIPLNSKGKFHMHEIYGGFQRPVNR